MAKLWIFGDSFSACYQENLNKHENNIPVWTKQLAMLLKVDTIEYRSGYGYSNEYIFKTVIEETKNFNHDDSVLIQLTEPYRRWFIKEAPNYGNYHTILNSKNNEIVTEQRKQAIKAYITYLQNEESDTLIYQQSFYALYSILTVSPISNWKILPGFDRCPGVNGNMCQIANLEFVDQQAKEKWYEIHKVDPRQNHMSEENHTVLAQKVYEWFNNPGTDINLLEGFKRGFLNVN